MFALQMSTGDVVLFAMVALMAVVVVRRTKPKK
jgi:hypothetical protein